jgi:CubicO group peptidase (beta-lactamase class C family)
VTAALATETPWWTPGTAHGYHVHTFGFLTGELVRRVSGLGPAAFLRRHVAEPLHADVSYGLAASERHRCAPYLFAPEARRATTATSVADAPFDPFLRERAYLNPPGATGYGTVNTPRWQDAELPSANLHATARGVARVYQALLQGKLVSQTTLDEATREASNGPDRVLGRPSRFGLGFQLTQPERPLGPNANAFGHFGAGGSLGFADPDAGLAFGYVMNRGGPQWRDPRNRALIDAVYGA